MEKCEHSGDICRAEELSNIITPETTETLVRKYCLGNKEICPQYREIEDSGIAFGMNVAKLIESAFNVYQRVKKKRE